MKKTGLIFTWEKGSLNDNAIRIFKENNIDFEYNHFGKLTADFYGVGLFQKIEYKPIGNNDFEICMP